MRVRAHRRVTADICTTVRDEAESMKGMGILSPRRSAYHKQSDGCTETVIGGSGTCGEDQGWAVTPLIRMHMRFMRI